MKPGKTTEPATRRSLRSQLVREQIKAFALLLALLVLFGYILLRENLLRVDILGVRDARGIAEFLLVLVPLLIILQAIIAWWSARVLLRPLARITAAAAIPVSRGDKQLPVGHGDELDKLCEALNRRNAECDAYFRDLLSKLSHELQMPLTVLRADTELTLRWATNAEEYKQALAGYLAQLQWLSKTIADVVRLGEAQAGHTPPNRTSENMAELVRVAVDAMRAKAAERVIQINASTPDEITALVDAAQIWRMLEHLLDNAVKFSPSYSAVAVDVTRENGWAKIAVTDSGLGIAPEHLPHIFDPFYRAAEAKQRGIQGSGLGLSFVRWIAEAHRGRVEVSSTPGKGSRFEVWLPCLPSAPKTHDRRAFAPAH